MPNGGGERRHFERRTGKDPVGARRMAGRCGALGRAPIYPKYGSQPETADAPSPSRPMSDRLARLAGRDQVPKGSGSDRRQDGGNLGASVGQVARFAQPRRQIGTKASPRHRSIVSQGGHESRPMRPDWQRSCSRPRPSGGVAVPAPRCRGARCRHSPASQAAESCQDFRRIQPIGHESEGPALFACPA